MSHHSNCEVFGRFAVSDLFGEPTRLETSAASRLAGSEMAIFRRGGAPHDGVAVRVDGQHRDTQHRPLSGLIALPDACHGERCCAWARMRSTTRARIARLKRGACATTPANRPPSPSRPRAAGAGGCATADRPAFDLDHQVDRHGAGARVPVGHLASERCINPVAIHVGHHGRLAGIGADMHNDT